ncbi:phosphatase [Planococcus sp. SSTMD024]|uniref:phosphatase n=1 Tax=Planococcus sp. SSTMD024 TaxID=3242163 RepID=UPI00351F08F7
MKQLIGGGIGVISGILLFGFTLVAAAVYSLHLREVGYSGEYGLYLTALGEVGIFPIILSLVLFIAGLVLLFKATDREWKAKYFLAAEETNSEEKEL